jgi:hypothetical protein
MEIDPTKTTLIIMEKCLQQANTIITIVAFASYTPIAQEVDIVR